MSAAKPTIGLIAGWGRYPLVIADALRQQGHPVCCLGIRHHADPALAELCDDFTWIGLGKFGRALRYFRRHGATRVTMAGKVHKVRLFERWAWLKHLPDWYGLRTFFPHFISGRKDRKDDTLLGAVVGAFAAGGITMSPATDFAPELLVRAGCLTDRRPTTGEERDIRFGWQLAKEMGRLDVGQSVVIKDRAAIAIEAIEGTDLCIRRAGELCPAGGLTVVKVAKPQQDMRFDVPTVGILTLQSMAAAGATCLAIEAGRTILVDEAEMLAFANRQRIAVVAYERAELE